MTSQRQLDAILDAFFAEGTTELADRVIEAALDEIDNTSQRHALRLPRRLQTMPLLTRLAAAAVIGVIAVGGALYLSRPSQTGVGTSSPTPRVSASPSEPAPTPTPQSAPEGPIGVGRQLQTATRLTYGRVLLAERYAQGDVPLADAALYDPATNTFSPTGSLGTARSLHTATLLVDGRVLITGGNDVTSHGIASAEIYDPATSMFSPAG